MPFSSLILYSILPLTVPLPVIPVIWAIPETDALISALRLLPLSLPVSINAGESALNVILLNKSPTGL